MDLLSCSTQVPNYPSIPLAFWLTLDISTFMSWCMINNPAKACQKVNSSGCSIFIGGKHFIPHPSDFFTPSRRHVSQLYTQHRCSIAYKCARSSFSWSLICKLSFKGFSTENAANPAEQKLINGISMLTHYSSARPHWPDPNKLKAGKRLCRLCSFTLLLILQVV